MPADKDRRPRHKDGGSSGLSSAPASPPQNQQQNPQNSRRRSDAARSSTSDSEQHPHHKSSSKTSLREKMKSGERLLSHKRKAPKIESDEEADIRKARRQRTTSASLDGGRPSKEAISTPAKPQHDSRNRSVSPHPRCSKLRNLAPPGTAESNMSPAKLTPHKTYIDAHGQTLLARACARGEYDVAKMRLGERRGQHLRPPSLPCAHLSRLYTTPEANE